jgi:hypothetical protein
MLGRDPRKSLERYRNLFDVSDADRQRQHDVSVGIRGKLCDEVTLA